MAAEWLIQIDLWPVRCEIMRVSLKEQKQSAKATLAESVKEHGEPEWLCLQESRKPRFFGMQL
jgi:hypothetical protein